MLARCASFIRRGPLAFSIAYGGAKTIAADVLVQKTLEGREVIDYKRSAVFLGFGCFQVGFVQYMVYSKLFPYLFKGAGTFSQQTFSQMMKDTQGLKNVVKQVVCDMCLYHPCCYFPVFYTCQEIVNDNVQSPSKTVHNAMEKYIPNAVDDWKNLWKIFVPVSVLQNAFCPVYLRVPFVATVGFFYCIILSSTRGDEVNKVANISQVPHTLPDDELEKRPATIRSRHHDSNEGVGMDELIQTMTDLGVSKASVALRHAVDDSEGKFHRGSGVVSIGRLVDGSELLVDQCLPEDCGEIASDITITCQNKFLKAEKAEFQADVWHE
mmetsp:Transcript_8801/g.16779  ORF Transcript_8801/g.16779 Transcript_8801/m.16779 type:complete len:324 (+) Transcript_8801:71-1042(+)